MTFHCIVFSDPYGNVVLIVVPAEVNPVTVQLDLDDLFQLDNLVLSFKVCSILYPYFTAAVKHISTETAFLESCYYIMHVFERFPSFSPTGASSQ